jgi:hypothetical protein
LIGKVQTGTVWIGLVVGIGLDWFGLDWIGSVLFGLDWIGKD